MNSRPNRLRCIDDLQLHETPNLGVHETGSRPLRLVPGVGFITIVDTARGDYRNLAIAYTLARDLALRPSRGGIDLDVLALIINRTIEDLSDAASIRTLVIASIENSKAILAKLEKSILLMEFNARYLAKFMKEGTLSKQDLIGFYSGEEARERYRAVEQEIKVLGT